jgi:hypothetical protein
MVLSYFFNNAWRWKEDLQYNLHLPEEDWEIPTQGIENTEWSDEFEKYQRDRLIMGALRYGKLYAKDKVQYDRISGMKRYIEEYLNTGNLECLVDVANYCILEFVNGNHPNKHFSTGDSEYHVTRL